MNLGQTQSKRDYGYALITASPPYTTTNVIAIFFTPLETSSSLALLDLPRPLKCKSLSCLRTTQSLRAAVTSSVLMDNPAHVNGGIGCRRARYVPTTNAKVIPKLIAPRMLLSVLKSLDDFVEASAR
jgi:hypothetical protein